MQRNSSKNDIEWLTPSWPAPKRVKALTTLRQGGVSLPPFESLNFGSRVGDDPLSVAENRRILREAAKLPSEPVWLNQVHGTRVVNLSEANAVAINEDPNADPEADAAVSFKANQVCVVTTADCLPVLFCNRGGTAVAAAHAGWRGLAAGVIEATVKSLNLPPEELLVFLGPALGPPSFEVGKDVRELYLQAGREMADDHVETLFTPFGAKWKLNIYEAAKHRLNHLGIASYQIYGGGFCTYQETERFFSFRRSTHESSGKTGRMASLIWLQTT